jgi:adenylyltransferase/sulfurtransferase
MLGMNPSRPLQENSDSLEPAVLDRYSRQIRFPQLGEAGQRRLLASRVLICGCGALGSVLAGTLARAGVGQLRIVDRDFLETNNLQRQMLFDEQDVANQLPKAIAAANKLKGINSHVTIEPVVADIDHTNIERFCAGVDLILDGTDNFETRFLMNDAALKLSIPWVYGGCLASEGQTMTIVPGQTACFRCLMPDPPAAGTTPTCDTAGIVAPIIGVIGSIQSIEAIKILSGHVEAIQTSLTVIDLWENRLRQIKLDALRESGDCPACNRGEFPWLDGQRGSYSAVLCGRNAVQLSNRGGSPIRLELLAAKLAGAGRVTHNAHLLRFAVGNFLLTVFPDGRAIVGGTDDVTVARQVYARYIGN